ncbi:5633_t:CDS:2 [Paraglomus occultum]|uniref:5633_t:CDS:1 n=1 Tax=Paraglomus occultum TaxID=144539 RepID=A0A9N8VFA3_9GLOM|nr:5633_t:CDS:2 [Paraglomus occultum]
MPVSSPLTFRSFTFLLLKLIPTLLFIPTRVLSTLIIYSESQAVLGTFSNVDFVLANSINYGTIKGRIAIVSFVNNTTENPCQIDPLPDDVDILVVPFEIAFSRGCRSYSDILKENGWYKEDGENPDTGGQTDTPPAVAELLSTETSYETVTGPDGQVTTNTKISTVTITSTFAPGSKPTTTVPGAPTLQPTPTAAGVVPTNAVPSIVSPVTGAVNSAVGGVNSAIGGITTVVGGVTSVVGGITTVVGGVTSVVGGVTTVVGGVVTDVQSTVLPTAVAGLTTLVPSLSVGLPALKPPLKEKRDIYNMAQKILVITSGNGGVPGLDEIYAGNRKILSNSIPSISLVSQDDMTGIRGLGSIIYTGEITSDSGPWVRLVQSTSWIVWSLGMGVGYFAITTFCLYCLVKTYGRIGFVITNPKYWIYPGIMIVCISSAIILEVSPGSIHEARIPLIGYAFMICFKNLMLLIIFIVVEMIWKTAAEIMCQKHNHHTLLSRKLSLVYTYLLYLCVFCFTTAFVVRMVSYSHENLPWAMPAVKMAFLVDCVCLIILTVEFIIFGMFMVTALKKKVSSSAKQKLRTKTAKKMLALMVLLVIAIVFNICASTLSFLPITPKNFWVSQSTQNIATAIAASIVIFVLHDSTIGRCLPKTYAAFEETGDNSITSQANQEIECTTITRTEGSGGGDS